MRRRMEWMVNPREALHRPGPVDGPEGQVRTMARVTDLVRRMLGMTAVVTKLDLDLARRVPGRVVGRELGKEEIVTEIAGHR